MKSATDRMGQNALPMKAPVHAEGGGDDPSLPGYNSFIDYPAQSPPPRFKTFGKFRAPCAGYTCRDMWPQRRKKRFVGTRGGGRQQHPNSRFLAMPRPPSRSAP